MKTMQVLVAILYVSASGIIGLYGGDTLHLNGTTEWQDYSPGSDRPNPAYHSENVFSTEICGMTWNFRVTNTRRPQWWAEIVYDGSNTYMIVPKARFGFLANGANSLPLTNSQIAAIDCSAGFPYTYDEMHTIIGWFTYGLTSRTIITNDSGIIDMPKPTTSARDTLFSYGYKWTVEFTEEGRYAKHCEIIRDKRLDLTDKEELLRPQFNYPETLQDYNGDMRDLSIRKAIPDGLVACRYSVLNWFETNGTRLPLSSKLESFWWDPKNGALPYPWHVFTLNVTNVWLSREPANVLPQVTMPTEVEDYRYKRSTPTHIFEYAKYTLNPGDAWKGNHDPAILAQVNDYLAHGRKYSAYANSRKLWIAWLLLAAVLAPLTIIIPLQLANRHVSGHSN